MALSRNSMRMWLGSMGKMFRMWVRVKSENPYGDTPKGTTWIVLSTRDATRDDRIWTKDHLQPPSLTSHCPAHTAVIFQQSSQALLYSPSEDLRFAHYQETIFSSHFSNVGLGISVVVLRPIMLPKYCHLLHLTDKNWKCYYEAVEGGWPVNSSKSYHVYQYHPETLSVIIVSLTIEPMLHKSTRWSKRSPNKTSAPLTGSVLWRV